ncbi:response regulator transcription factor [Catellatospora sp. KI3]|uniref:LuxR C-terminal-related transcriptional regulator n=1 Tax=Catellatospora sp. KI3 TaxID=3041620 RepID=UPI0024826465|nr:response regulator transcription factor [Catellatospora sp. KI3]MDI1460714.1 response regulator transcription factor [Catellatospora sp. KI3]
MRVAILERDPLLWAGLRSVLRAHSRIAVVGDFHAVRDGLSAVPTLQPDLLLISDLWLHDDLPLNLPEKGSARRELPVVAVMDADDRPTLRRAVTKSVRGFVDRNTSHEDLGNAVLDAAGGRTFLSSSIAASLVGWMAAKITHEPSCFADIETSLTVRELEVFEAMGDGITNVTIARRLGIQEATVRSHVYHILTKLNLRTRTEAALAAYKYANLDSPARGSG